jgi:PAS domain S-box-containing protein
LNNVNARPEHASQEIMQLQRCVETDFQNAFDEIEKSEANLRQVIDAIPAMAWCNLPAGPNEFLNKRWHDYTGLSPEASHGWGWQVAFHPEDLPLLMETWRELLISGEPGEIEARLRRFDGVYRWFLISVEPLHDEAGRIVRWYGTSTDIEDRKQTEDKLRQENVALKRAEEKILGQEAELRQMLELVPQLVAVFGPDHELIYANRMALDYLGVSLEEWRQTRDMHRFYHPDDRDRIRTSFDRALSTGAAYQLEFRIRKGDRSYHSFLARHNPLRDELGRIARWYVAYTDIEDRKRHEESLQHENAALREEITHRDLVKLARGGNFRQDLFYRQLLAWQARDVLAYIDSHITDRVLVADLSAIAHCSSAHFSRLFKRTFDQSPAAFVLKRRVELAARRMLDTEISLSDIALSCGFTDQPHFTNRFRRVMQETPAAWRRAHKSQQARSAIAQSENLFRQCP